MTCLKRAIATGLMAVSASIAAVCVAPTLAHAETRTLYSAGLWSSYGGTDAEQRPVCGVVTVGGDGRRIDISQYAADGGIDLSLQKESWSIPPNTEIDLQVQFDRDTPVPSRGIGGSKRVVSRMSFDRSVPFMRALRQGSQIRILFASGNEPAWTGGLSGSGRAIDSFNDCRARLASQNPTQPFASAAPSPVVPASIVPTQPFAVQPQSQPQSQSQPEPMPMPLPASSFQNNVPPPYPAGLPPPAQSGLPPLPPPS